MSFPQRRGRKRNDNLAVPNQPARSNVVLYPAWSLRVPRTRLPGSSDFHIWDSREFIFCSKLAVVTGICT